LLHAVSQLDAVTLQRELERLVEAEYVCVASRSLTVRRGDVAT